MSESTDNIFNMTFDDLVGQVSKEGENLDAKQTEPKTEEKTETEPKTEEKTEKTEEKTEKTAAKEFKPKTKAKEVKPKTKAKEFKPNKAKEFKPQTDTKKITNAFDAPATSSKSKETDDTKKRTAQYEVDTADVFGNIEKDPVPQDEFSPLENSKAVVDPNEKPAPHAKVFGAPEENATVANKTETKKDQTKTEKRAQSVIDEVKEDNMTQNQNGDEVVVKIKVDRKILDLIDQKDLAELVKKSTASLNDNVKKLAKESFDKLLG